MRCEVMVWREHGPACCSEPMAHAYEGQAMCHRHFVASLNRGYPFRQYDERSEVERRARRVFELVMA